MRDETVFVSTGSYPWDVAAERTFLDLEVEVLRERFGHVVLVPESTQGNRAATHAAVEVDASYARERGSLTKRDLVLRALRTKLVVEDVAHRGTLALGRRPLRELVRHAALAHHARDWAVRAVRRRGLTPERVVFYSFWWTACATGFGLARAALPRLRVVTRAHGFDLYEERHSPPYIPGRRAALRLLDGVFPDSDRGTVYLAAAASRAGTWCETARLGVADPRVLCSPSGDGVLRLVSCSFQVPVKRLDLLLSGVAALARQRPSLRVEWTHFGTGKLQDELTTAAHRIFPPNATVRFEGYATQRALFDWYGAHPIDVFVNVSASEGTPVSIMEAIACGIPVLATAVGGNPEIVEARNGLLLPADPGPEEVARGLAAFASGGGSLGALRAGSRAVWAEKYDASRNYAAFADLLASCRRPEV